MTVITKNAPFQENVVIITGASTGIGRELVEACARLIVKAAAQRKREIIIPSIGRVGLWLRLIAPAVFDRYVSGVMERQSIRRSNTESLTIL